jgi:hypothetical protein
VLSAVTHDKRIAPMKVAGSRRSEVAGSRRSKVGSRAGGRAGSRRSAVDLAVELAVGGRQSSRRSSWQSEVGSRSSSRAGSRRSAAGSQRSAVEGRRQSSWQSKVGSRAGSRRAAAGHAGHSFIEEEGWDPDSLDGPEFVTWHACSRCTGRVGHATAAKQLPVAGPAPPGLLWTCSALDRSPRGSTFMSGA